VTKEHLPMVSPSTLSSYQRRVVWLISQGHTVTGAAGIIGTHVQSVKDSLRIARSKLSSRTNAEAVLKAYRLGIIGAWEICGSRTGYLHHMDLDEDACPACRRAHTEWMLKGRFLAVPEDGSGEEPAERVPQPLLPEQVRILKAFQCGRTHREIQAMWGCGRSRLHRLVTDMYVRLCVDDVYRDARREAAIRAGKEQGYLAQEAPVLPPVVLPPGQGVLTEIQVRTLKAVRDRTLQQAAEFLGIPRSSLSSRLNSVYFKLGVSGLPREDKREAALKEAVNLGYSV
jgi:DNA-binding NarL/FixJ family response regulator